MPKTVKDAEKPTTLLRYSHTIGLSTMDGRGFYFPVDTAIGSDGKLFVLSRSYDDEPLPARVTVCDIDSEYYGTFGSFGTGAGQFTWATAIAIDSEDNVYVSDEYTNRITIFDSSGKFLTSWGTEGTQEGQLDGPSGFDFDSDDCLYIVDHHNNRIQKFTKDGSFLFAFGSEGNGIGEFNLPWGLSIGHGGNVYVADWRNDRIQKFSKDGVFLASFGDSGNGDGQFHRPSSVAVDAEGYIYVADWGNERVQILNPDGRFVMKLRGEGTSSKWAMEWFEGNVEEAKARAKSDLEPNVALFKGDVHEESAQIEKYFWAPVSVKLDNKQRLYVTESHRHRLQIYVR